ncbi:MAG: amidohydrolase family protein [Spirochaetales bacterium]|nr:amidohydrolase family protein [Spirochaetales bacterium]
MELSQLGEPLKDIPFIDTHCHYGTWPETSVPYSLDQSRLINEMDRYGCDLVWMCASGPGWADNLRRQNDRVFDFAKRHPRRVIPYCTLSSHDPARAVDELLRCMEYPYCIGVKMHRYHQPQYTVKGDFLRPILEILDERKLVYLNHQFINLNDLEWAAATYPGITFLAGHGVDTSINDLACRFNNIKDSTCAAMGYREIETEVKRLGRSDTILVGSDFGLFHMGFGIGMIAYADIEENAKRSILGANALSILKKTDWWSSAGLLNT